MRLRSRNLLVLATVLVWAVATPIVASNTFHPNAVFINVPKKPGTWTAFTLTVSRDGDFTYFRVMADRNIGMVEFWLDADGSRDLTSVDFAVRWKTFFGWPLTYGVFSQIGPLPLMGISQQDFFIVNYEFVGAIGAELGVPNNRLADTFGLEVWVRDPAQGQVNSLCGTASQYPYISPERHMDQFVLISLAPQREVVTETVMQTTITSVPRLVYVFVPEAGPSNPATIVQGEFNGQAFNITTTDQSVVELANSGELHVRIYLNGAEKLSAGRGSSGKDISVDLTGGGFTTSGLSEEQAASIELNIWSTSGLGASIGLGYPQ